MEVDELGHCTRDIKSEIERKQKIEKELGCKFIRIDPSRENFDTIDEFYRIKKHNIKSTKNSTIDKISGELLNLELKKKQLNKN